MKKIYVTKRLNESFSVLIYKTNANVSGKIVYVNENTQSKLIYNSNPISGKSEFAVMNACIQNAAGYFKDNCIFAFNELTDKIWEQFFMDAKLW